MNQTAIGETAQAMIDASSAILLYKAGLIDIGCDMLRLMMTRSVYAEVTVPQQVGAVGFQRLADRRPGIMVLDDPRDDAFSEPAPDIDRLHRGERDTLRHYLNGTSRFVIIDDGKAVRTCRRHGIPHVNALLFPKLLFFSKRLTAGQMDHFFLRLCVLGRYSDAVIAWAKNCTARELDFFCRTKTGPIIADGSHRPLLGRRPARAVRR